MFSTRQLLAAALTCSAAMAMTGQAHGQAYPSGQVNVSGATLFRDFFIFPASTNEYIDITGDANYGANGTFPPPQLAPTYPAAGYFTFDYRGVGSGNGLKEMVNYQLYRLDGVGVNNGLPAVGDYPAEGGIINRVEYVDQTGNLTGVGNAANNGGAPVVQTSIDIGVMDVPTTWFVINTGAGAASWNARPGDAQYGNNPTATTTGQSNKLKTLSVGAFTLNTNTAAPDDHTVFDQTIAWVPIGYIANPGTGLENVKTTELQHLFTTGRMPTGENLMAVTRDSGSGTRNGAMNSIGVDPSWGSGDNQSPKNDDASFDELGPNFASDAKGGSSRMEGTVQNARLAVGYTGLLGNSRAIVDMEGKKYELLNVMKDIDGDGDGNPDGNTYVRPTADNIINNADPNDGWQFGGSETMATVGDPNANRPVGDPLKTANPAMANASAAGYLNNITDSIAAFVALPGDPNNAGSPGEALVNNFTLNAAIERIGPDGIDFSDPNPVFNANVNAASLAALTANLAGTGVDLGGVDPTGTVGAGKVPTRTTGITYSDGNVSDVYVDVDGGTLTYGGTLNNRNKIAGDFSNDGARSTADVAKMMDWANYRGLGTLPAAGAQPETGTGLAVEIIGDFDGNGNFDEEDIRYWGDGLHIVAGKLDRKAGFTAIDAEYGANFFGTTIATGKTYANGDSRGDIAGAAISAGGKPTGHDGTVDALDIDYVYANFGDFSIIDQAVFMDLTADMTGDLIVNQLDIDDLVLNVLGTSYGDVDLNGIVDATDEGIVNSNLGQLGLGWAGGDLNGDGVTDTLDLAFFGLLQGDLNGDGFVGIADLNIVLGQWNQNVTPGDLLQGDPSGDGFVGINDLNTVLGNWNAGTPPTAEANIPEPGALALMGLGLGAVLKRRKA
ncbi:MAG: PEP-CTERM sorting domain-containing protein [Phycisphaerales bacterium]